MEITVYTNAGSCVTLEQHLKDMESKIMTLQATIVQLEYAAKSKEKEETSEAPKSDYDKLKEEIIEEVNLIISDLL